MNGFAAPLLLFLQREIGNDNDDGSNDDDGNKNKKLYNCLPSNDDDSINNIHNLPNVLKWIPLPIVDELNGNFLRSLFFPFHIGFA